MSTSSKVDFGPNYDWLLVGACLIFIVFFQSSRDFVVAVHYIIYTIGLVSAIVHFFFSGRGRKPEIINVILATTIFLIIFCDTFVPVPASSNIIALPNIPFSFLKILFYVLIAIQFPNLLFSMSSVFDYDSGVRFPAITLLFGLCVITFGQNTIEILREAPTVELGTFASYLFQPNISVSLLFFITLVALMALFLRLRVALFQKSEIIAIVSSVLAIAITINSYLPIALSIKTSYQVAFFAFLLILTLKNKVSRHSVRILLVAAFSLVFLSLYYNYNETDIIRAVEEAMSFQEAIGYWGNVALIAISLLASVYQIAAELQKNVPPKNPAK